METLVLVLMVLVTFNFVLKLSLMKPWQIGLFALACAIFVGFMWEYAIEQSRSQVSMWLSDQKLMLDTSVILTVEVVWQMAYCLLAGYLLSAPAVRRRTLWVYRVLRFFPGILILGALVSALVWAEYTFTGRDFQLIAWTLAATVLLCIGGSAFCLKSLLPEKDLRLEVLFLSNLLVLVLGVIATVNGHTTFHGSDDVEWGALTTFIGISILCGATGYFRKVKRKNK